MNKGLQLNAKLWVKKVFLHSRALTVLVEIIFFLCVVSTSQIGMIKKMLLEFLKKSKENVYSKRHLYQKLSVQPTIS